MISSKPTECNAQWQGRMQDVEARSAPPGLASDQSICPHTGQVRPTAVTGTSQRAALPNEFGQWRWSACGQGQLRPTAVRHRCRRGSGRGKGLISRSWCDRRHRYGNSRYHPPHPGCCRAGEGGNRNSARDRHRVRDRQSSIPDDVLDHSSARMSSSATPDRQARSAIDS